LAFAVLLIASLGFGCLRESADQNHTAAKVKKDTESSQQNPNEQKESAGEVNVSNRPPAPKDDLPKTIDIDFIPAGLEKQRAIPTSSPLTDARVKLGRKLFFETRFSRDSKVSCASCHRPDHGFASPDKLAIGVDGKEGKRNAPTLFNRAFGKTFFWDGRVRSLETQSLQPFLTEHEFDQTVRRVLPILKSDDEYPEMFVAAFADEGDESNDPDQYITGENLAKAIASFERTILLGDSPVDRFQAGVESELNASEKAGLWIFESSGMCWKCHSGKNYTDELFHNTGVGFGKDDRDIGLYDTTRRRRDKFNYKTPTLRGVALTAPYMHNGSIATLREVVEFYNKGGTPADPTLSDKIKPLKLSEQQIDDVVAFLKALSRRSKSGGERSDGDSAN
jgi:cytochrome c peroxidase